MNSQQLPLEFAYLADHPGAIPLIAGWWFDEWERGREGASSDKVAEKLRAEVSRDRLPIQILALESGVVVGVAVLKDHELVHLYPELHYWLGRVYVAPTSRRRGIGAALSMKIIELASQLGVPSLHLQTEALDGGLYSRLGWKPIEMVTHDGIERLVMSRSIPPIEGGAV